MSFNIHILSIDVRLGVTKHLDKNTFDSYNIYKILIFICALTLSPKYNNLNKL